MSVANATAAGKAKKLTPADKGNNITTDAFINILIYLPYIFYIWYIIVLVDNGSTFWYCQSPNIA